MNLDISPALLDPCVQITEVFAHAELRGLASLLSSTQLFMRIYPLGSSNQCGFLMQEVRVN